MIYIFQILLIANRLDWVDVFFFFSGKIVLVQWGLDDLKLAKSLDSRLIDYPTITVSK